ncbi:MFS transporter [Yinghuangia seranimata]|uniref:MFS transporter n=1 Tax=Yinghuangia seranimata TaxID=408067 RepID=UPI00248CC410|nr:MFS transporter [Yinghuangia seranimata]MDI2128569.1 MFS transporter [Yinghuangia seranimata]
MRTYRELFTTPEFRPLFGASAAHNAAATVGGLAIGTLVFDSTGSPLLAALAMFGPSLAQVLGAMVLLSAADRMPPRGALTGIAALFAASQVVIALPGLPVGAVFAIVVLLSPVAALGGGVRYGLMTEVLPRDGYLLGRSVLNMANGVMQIVGFAVGGVLVAVLSPRGTLLVAAGLYAVSALASRFGLAARPARASGRASAAQTWSDNRRLWASRERRYVYLALWVPNGLIVGCEALFIPYSASDAGLLFAFCAVGMLAGDTVAGRFVPSYWRARLEAPMRLLLAVPYLAFVLRPPLPVALVLVAVASVGYSATLMLQERLIALTPDELSGHALGLHTSGMVTMQGVGAALAGGVAQVTSPATGMTVMAVASIAVTAALVPGLRPTRTVVSESRPAAAAEVVGDAVTGPAERPETVDR